MNRRTHSRTALATALALVLLALGGVTATAADSKDDSIDLNSASAETLQRIPGIGPALAQRIVAFRQEHGPFERVEDLLKVKGIGEKSLAKLRPYVKVSRSK